MSTSSMFKLTRLCEKNNKLRKVENETLLRDCPILMFALSSALGDCWRSMISFERVEAVLSPNSYSREYLPHMIMVWMSSKLRALEAVIFAAFGSYRMLVNGTHPRRPFKQMRR